MKTIINSNEDLIVLNLHKVESSKYINLVIKVVHSIILCSTFFFKLNSLYNSDTDPDLAIGLYSKCYRKQKHISTFKGLELKVSF